MKHLAGKQQTNDEVVSAVRYFFKDQDESFFTTGIQALQHRWKQCGPQVRIMLKN